MRIVVAPNAFKGSLTALQAAEAIRDGILAVLTDAEIVLVPIADGGDGTVDALVAATGGERRALPVRGPLGEPVEAGHFFRCRRFFVFRRWRRRPVSPSFRRPGAIQR